MHDDPDGSGPFDRDLDELLASIDLDDAATGHGVVGAVVGVSRNGRRSACCFGVANTATRTPVTSDTRFLAGSVTKAMTASMIAQMVAEGRIDVDRPVQHWVPEFRTHDERSSASITVRHLLTHTGGFDGDVWPDHGDDPGALARFVASMGELEQVARPGTRFSYNNAGYAVLGRLVELVDGVDFQTALQRRIAEPAGCALTTVTPDDPRVRAVGHVRTATGDARPVDTIVGPACMAPAGSRTWATIDDLLAFGELHLGRIGGVDRHRAHVAMRQPQWHVHDPNNGGTMALGVFLDDRWGTTVVFHDGGVAGQAAYLRIVPEDDAVLALMCTGGTPQVFHRSVIRDLARITLGREAPAAAIAAADTVAPDRIAGTYASSSTSLEITSIEGAAHATITWGSGTATAVQAAPMRLAGVDDRVALVPVDGRDYVLVFPSPSDPCDHVLAGMRMLIRR